MSHFDGTLVNKKKSKEERGTQVGMENNRHHHENAWIKHTKLFREKTQNHDEPPQKPLHVARNVTFRKAIAINHESTIHSYSETTIHIFPSCSIKKRTRLYQRTSAIEAITRLKSTTSPRLESSGICGCRMNMHGNTGEGRGRREHVVSKGTKRHKLD